MGESKLSRQQMAIALVVWAMFVLCFLAPTVIGICGSLCKTGCSEGEALLLLGGLAGVPFAVGYMTFLIVRGLRRARYDPRR
jgi:hypothetical protein